VSGRRRSSVLRAAVGIAISVVAFAVILRQVDLARTGEVLATAAPGWVVFMLAMTTLDLLFRAWRWQRLLAPIHVVPYPRMLAYLGVGYVANNVLPARLGELVRSHYLGDREGISRTTTLGTVVVERVVDTAMVVAIAATAIVVLQVRGLVANAVLVGFAFVGLLVLAIAFLILAHRLPGAARVTALADRWPRIQDLVGKLRGGLAVAGKPRTLGEALALSACAWTATTLGFAAGAQAVGVQLTLAQAALLASGTALATAVPAGPGNLGTFDLAAATIAQTLGVPVNTAFAIALLTHASTLLVTTVLGSIALLRLGWTRADEPDADGAAGTRTEAGAALRRGPAED
jgi:glycosyltransferase 2 family protein